MFCLWILNASAQKKTWEKVENWSCSKNARICGHQTLGHLIQCFETAWICYHGAERCGKDQKEELEYSKLSKFDNKADCQQWQCCNVISFSFIEMKYVSAYKHIHDHYLIMARHRNLGVLFWRWWKLEKVYSLVIPFLSEAFIGKGTVRAVKVVINQESILHLHPLKTRQDIIIDCKGAVRFNKERAREN